MKPIPFAWIKIAAWAVFAQSAAFVLFLWWEVLHAGGDPVLALGITVVAALTYPDSKYAGWGVWGGRNLCPNMATFIVACGVTLLSAIPFWSSLLHEGVTDYLFLLGWLLPGLLLVRSYSEMAKSYKS